MEISSPTTEEHLMRQRVVVLGTTEASLAAAREAKERRPEGVDVTLVRVGDDLPDPVARELHDHGVTVVHTAARSVDLKTRSVRLCDGRLFHYDDLIDGTCQGDDPDRPGRPTLKGREQRALARS
jgi:NADH dehydrogenase FAD-containing subunit